MTGTRVMMVPATPLDTERRMVSAVTGTRVMMVPATPLDTERRMVSAMHWLLVLQNRAALVHYQAQSVENHLHRH